MRLFHVKKRCRIVAVNFTYKRKKGLIGSLYYRYMRYAVGNVDGLHVLSRLYAERCSKDLGVDIGRFIVTHFGVPDTYAEWNDLKTERDGYVLSIGRSNRDFDFLVDVWSDERMADVPLVIIADSWKPSKELPKNVTWLNDVVGDASKPWIKGCKMMVLPISDGNIASGDTVLLTAMMGEKLVVVTKPSTLAEMYIKHGENGLALEKETNIFIDNVKGLFFDEEKIRTIGGAARKSYLENFSREAMGKAVGTSIKKIFNK